MILVCLPSLAACQVGGEQAARDEFKTYWTQMIKVLERQNAQTAKAQDKADAESGALNAYGVYCTAMGKCYERAADGYAGIQPPEGLQTAHTRLVRETRTAGRVMDRVGDEIRAEIRDSDLGELSQKWIDRQTKPSQKAMTRQVAASKKWRDAAIAEGTRLGVEWKSD
jgi:hypothetical protein